jgi:hypothetical protein
LRNRHSDFAALRQNANPSTRKTLFYIAIRTFFLEIKIDSFVLAGGAKISIVQEISKVQ